MSGESDIKVEGRIIEATNDDGWWAELENGHRLIVRRSKMFLKQAVVQIGLDMRVLICVSSCDLTKGWIIQKMN